MLKSENNFCDIMFTSCFHDQRFTMSNKVSIKIVKIIFFQKKLLSHDSADFLELFSTKSPELATKTYKLKGTEGIFFYKRA